jgi:transcription antitermination factor NusG
LVDNWYALQVYTTKERWTAEHLAARGFEHLVLLFHEGRQWSDRFKTVCQSVFPGYVFCRFPLAQRSQVLAVPGVIRVVGVGKQPSPVDSQEIEALRRVEHLPGMLRRWPYLRQGDEVQIEGGPLDGLIGNLVNVKKGPRVVVSVTLLQRSVAVEVDGCRIRPVNSSLSRCA